MGFVQVFQNPGIFRGTFKEIEIDVHLSNLNRLGLLRREASSALAPKDQQGQVTAANYGVAGETGLWEESELHS